ncbi:hypothetical protein M5K25_018057 [Dendrobium thyrsiflorum]|uniref:Uncharacterized protein n=1 Tax=Dendrobium thyrsiflorum TaxID=117978 RepID=A0ABD0UH35_DENTH
MIGRESRGKIKPIADDSNHNSDYQTISKLDDLIRLDETNPTSLRTPNSDISKSENYPSNRLRSRGTLDPKLEGIKRETEDRSCPLAPPRPPPDHHLKALSSAGPPPEGPEFRRTTT